jgi:thioredoxin-related protein
MKLLILIFCSVIYINGFAQETKLYNPAANADADIKAAILEAKKENKYVLLQGGGNWCKWCIEFARFCKEDKKTLLSAAALCGITSTGARKTKTKKYLINMATPSVLVFQYLLF